MENTVDKRKIFINDDEQGWARTMGQWLSKVFTNLEVAVAYTGHEGVSMTETL
jgi:hypothetical protein